ncbi:hypothetical protein ABIB82_001152 [Bradyrhizobium sp. i1.8.4]|uniref:hypothetical protein n=1 Tax=unclassified Bradyrhizobium TaxID=2631580 RepID=UPI003D1FD47A
MKMVRQAILVSFAVASIGMLASNAAWARGGGFHGGFGRGGFYRGYGWGIGPGFFAPGYYYGYPAYGYPYYGGCYLVRRRVHTARGWRYRTVRVCD